MKYNFVMDIKTNTYLELKNYFDNILNKDKSSFQTSNDEPTPIGCIEEMLSKIPDSFWSNDIKILDPCCGNGNFHLVSLNKLRQAGKKDADILQNILYFNDISDVRLNTVKDIFGGVNITKQNFLLTNTESKFDLIIANPPYAKFDENGKRTAKNHTMIRDFISKSLEIINDNGYIIYIVPDNWMSLADRNEVIKQLTQYEFIWLDIHTSKKWFPKIGSSFTWFVLKKQKHIGSTFKVSGTYKSKQYVSEVLSADRDYIPLLYTKEVQSILNKTIDNTNLKRFAVETSSDLHKFTKKSLIVNSKDNNHPYRLNHTFKQKVWSSRPHKFQDGWKVFITTTDTYKTFIDNCGMTQSIAFIRCESKEAAENICATLNHPLYRFINDICRWGNFNNIRILQRFPIPTTTNIYNSFGLTIDEQNFIETFI